MTKRVLRLLGVVALAIGVATFAAPMPSHAITITDVSVTVGATTYCGSSLAAPCAGIDIWAIPAAGITLGPGATLILAQTSGFNFDTSEGNLPSCSAALPCATSISINGVAVVIAAAASTVLAAGNVDPGTPAFNEATDYVLAETVPFSHTLHLGYADNVHTDACADTSGDCLPSPFGGPFAIGTANPFIQTLPFHCGIGGATDCFDSGVLLITGLAERPPGVPAPSTLLLLGTGLLGVAAWGRRRLQGKN